MKIYISHSTGCVGWDMKSIYENTQFELACRTSRFKPSKDFEIKMLDWDYLAWKKNPQKIEQLHLEIVKEYSIETVMSMDLWDYNIQECLDYTNELLKHANRVLIPVHFYCKEILNYDLAYPNANWFAKNVFPPPEYRKNIKHILGGSPQSQLKHLDSSRYDLQGNEVFFRNVESIDGNQLFNCAVRVGKEWFPSKPHWRNTGDLTNEIKFRNSAHRFDEYIKRWETARELKEFQLNGIEVINQ